MRQLAFTLLISLPFAFSACKKDSDPSKTELLTGNKKWVLTAATIDPSITLSSGGTTTNIYNQLPGCAKDDIIIFATDGKATFDEGATKCAVSDPQTESGTWAFNTDQTILSLTQNSKTTSISIKTFTSNKLNGTYQEVINGSTYTIDATYEVK